MKAEETKEFVKARYGGIASKEAPGCSPSGRVTDAAKQSQEIGYSEQELESVPEAAVMGLGCGNPTALAELREGETVLDLGSGGGLDVFLAARKVGKKGKAIGVDMTAEMIQKAKKNAEVTGYGNVEFRLGEIEHLPVEDSSVDVIISNCVINLSPDKLATFREAHRVLKPGGRLHISDLVTAGELPEEIRRSFDAWAGCIAGALEKQEYLDKIRAAGFAEVTVVEEHPYGGSGMNDAVAGKITSVQVKAVKSQ